MGAVGKFSSCARPENVFQRATQSTTQKAETDLIEESNATVLYTIKSTIETDVQQNLYNFADASIVVAVCLILLSFFIGERKKIE